MADGYFPTLVSKDRNANLVTNPIFVNLSNGTSSFSLGGGAEAGAILVTIANDSTGVLSIDDNGGSITVDGTVAATQSGTWVLGANSGVDIGDVTINNAAGAAAVNIQDGGNSITVDGSVTVSATNLDIRDLLHTQDSVAIGDGTGVILDVREVDTAAGATDSGIMALAIRDDVLTTLTPADGDYVSLRVDSTGKLWTNTTLSNTETTPLYVYQVNSIVSGYEVHSYDTQSALASDTADNHDYAVTGSNFMLKQVLVSSSGACKIEVQTGPVASLATIAVGFIPKHGGSWEWTLAVAKEVPVASTGTCRVIRTNREGAAQDVYSTIIGNDV